VKGVAGVAGVQELKKFRSSEVQEFRSSGVRIQNRLAVRYQYFTDLFKLRHQSRTIPIFKVFCQNQVIPAFL